MGLLRTRLHLGGRRDVRLELADELLVGDVGLRGDRDLVQPAALVEQPLRGRQVEARERRPADGRDRAEADEARDPQPLGRAFGLDPDVWPSCKFSFSAVDSSITTSPGPGQVPSTSVSGLKRESPLAMLKPRLGAPP